jgi:predicted  nucleic acid-binding Zn-ribbon protein
MTQQEREQVMSIVYEYGLAYNKLEAAQNQMKMLSENVTNIEGEINEIRKREQDLISNLRETYGEDVITADYLFNEIKK